MLSRLLTRREQVLIAGAAGSLILGAGALFWYHAGPAPAPASLIELNGTPSPAVQVQASMPAVLPVPRPSDTAPAAPESAPVLPLQTTSVPAAPLFEPEPRRLTLSVQGAVSRPGVYYLDGTSRVHDAIRAAGGATDDADTRSLNLSARLIDGTTLTIPQRAIAEASGKSLRMRGSGAVVYNLPQYTMAGMNAPSAAPAHAEPTDAAAAARSDTAPAVSGGAASGLINLNTASQADLETLPGIGPKLAERIIAYRENTPYSRVDDLMNVSGIGDVRFEAVKDLITVD